MRYQTIQDVIEHVIRPALADLVDEYDVKAIAHDAFDFRFDVDEHGHELAGTAGFRQTVSVDAFWVIVASHHAAPQRPHVEISPGAWISVGPLVDRHDEIAKD